MPPKIRGLQSPESRHRSKSYISSKKKKYNKQCAQNTRNRIAQEAKTETEEKEKGKEKRSSREENRARE